MAKDEEFDAAEKHFIPVRIIQLTEADKLEPADFDIFDEIRKYWAQCEQELEGRDTDEMPEMRS